MSERTILRSQTYVLAAETSTMLQQSLHEQLRDTHSRDQVNFFAEDQLEDVMAEIRVVAEETPGQMTLVAFGPLHQLTPRTILFAEKLLAGHPDAAISVPAYTVGPEALVKVGQLGASTYAALEVDLVARSHPSAVTRLGRGGPIIGAASTIHRWLTAWKAAASPHWSAPFSLVSLSGEGAVFATETLSTGDVQRPSFDPIQTSEQFGAWNSSAVHQLDASLPDWDLPPTSISRSGTTAELRLSIVVIAYDMPRQAMNTLLSLSAAQQHGVDESEYEVIVVENNSGNNLDSAAVESLGNNFSYLLRNEMGVSPAAAINEGLRHCSGEQIGLMIDGARMVSPGVVAAALRAGATDPEHLLAIPGYNLGDGPHHLHQQFGHDEEVEQRLLSSINWPMGDGYHLFDIASNGFANEHGFLLPMIESNCMFASKAAFESIGGANEQFRLPGGGALNLHMYRQLGVSSLTRSFFVAFGEGSFHQFHGGVTTQESDESSAVIDQSRDQLLEMWDHEFHGVSREPILIGSLHPSAAPFSAFALQRLSRRWHNRNRWTTSLYTDDFESRHHWWSNESTEPVVGESQIASPSEQ